ncbi:MAG: alkane 1-monooxygenase [Gammaproteobacteria bacterium]|nr:alkane 1-monooxygenase [Gammaproteobacteria bacterium]
MGAYLRYFGTHLLVAAAVSGLLAGGPWSWGGLAAGVVFWIGGDALSRVVAPRPPAYAHPALLDAALYSLLPAVVALTLVYAWSLADTDLLGLGAACHIVSGFDCLAARSAGDALDRLGGAWSFALAIAMAGILTAHELVHRTRDPLALAVGRWMLAMAFNSSLEVAHVQGHHREVGTPADPATARRGENIYHFYVRSSLGQVAQAWRIERARLAGRGAFIRLADNRVLRGALRAAAVAGGFLWAGGLAALGWFLLASAFNKLLLEALNYMEHYGLVRETGAPIEPRHAWDSLSAFSHAALFNLPWHADHHSRAGVPYPELGASEAAPRLPLGYLATLPIVLVPPLWFRHIAPPLAAWDRDLASPAERALGAVRA